ncbi:YezD family protein [Novosphingobium sp.]|uniref:YezD family protein n=1 Tax=Novosphingobium sp. TaxID=1874826 RepID=UPI0025D0FDC1|nr:YezD family protein [Novosphingobium sp.]
MSLRQTLIDSHQPSSTSRDPSAQKPLDAVAEALERMRFGVIQLTVHDGRLVQLDVTERRRFA